jgi:hypothetical protein
LSSFVAAQGDRRDSKLVAARAALVTCARDECPGEVRGSCATWLGEVEASLPTVVLAARTSDGRELLDVRVTIDDAPFVEALDGRARPIDPGVHDVRYFARGFGAKLDRVAVREGEKNRQLLAVFQAPEPVLLRPVPTSSAILAGLGLAGLGVFAVAGLSGRFGPSSLASLDACKPNCSQAEASRVHTKFIVADVGLVTGLVSLGVATFFYATRPAGQAAR